MARPRPRGTPRGGGMMTFHSVLSFVFVLNFDCTVFFQLNLNFCVVLDNSNNQHTIPLPFPFQKIRQAFTERARAHSYGLLVLASIPTTTSVVRWFRAPIKRVILVDSVQQRLIEF